MTGYVYLAAAIVLELCGTTCMKLSDGFGNRLFAAGTVGITLIVVGVVLCNFFGANH